ncbi:MAG TPA: hypothetical protein VFE25_11770 [Opitutaceae bacterium]|jgi:hypothetical protein|nr:hypothetical protein [Opitutaceae bacterium]
MKPRLIQGDEEYREALEHLKALRATGSEEDIRLWEHLTQVYSRERLTKDSPLLLDAFLGKLKNTPTKRLDLVDILIVQAKKILPKPRQGPPLFSDKTLLFFLAVAAAFYLRMMYHASYFPIFFEGEESKVLDLAKATVDYAAYMDSWWAAFMGGLIEYNKGFAWLLVPFYKLYGYDVRLVVYVLPILYSALIGAFYTIYRKAYPRSSLLSFAVVSMAAILCVSLRRYKWHTVTFLSALSVYTYFLPKFYSGATLMRDRSRTILAAVLFALSCYLYFGSLMYALPFVILIVFFSSKAERRQEFLVAGLALVAFALMAFASYHSTERWRVRVGEELSSLRGDFTPQGLRVCWWATRDFFFTQVLSVPYLAIFVAGVLASCRKIRAGDCFALINSVLLACIWAFQAPIGGLNNPDQMNWSMIPLLGLLLIGCDAIFAWMRERIRYGAVISVVLAAAVCWGELGHYVVLSRDAPYQEFVQDRNTRSQLELLLWRIRDDPSEKVRYFLPAPSVPEVQGGFDYKAALVRVDTPAILGKATQFTSLEDLRRKITELPGNRTAIVFLSVGSAEDNGRDTVADTLFGQAPEVIHPCADIYKIKFLVRKFEFAPGELAWPR